MTLVLSRFCESEAIMSAQEAQMHAAVQEVACKQLLEVAKKVSSDAPCCAETCHGLIKSIASRHRKRRSSTKPSRSWRTWMRTTSRS